MSLELRLAQPRTSDGLAGLYTPLSEDASAEGPLREAAVLLVAAEARLDGDEDHEQALQSAEEALRLFRSASDQRAVADTLRLVIACAQTKASALINACDEAGWKEALDTATERAREEVASARAEGDRYREAAMRLSEAECLLMVADMKGGGSHEACQFAEQAATDARAVFKEVGAAKMEGLACLALAAVHYASQAQKAAAAASGAALELLAGDPRCKARALHATALAISVGVCTGANLERGLQCAKSAMEIYGSLGLAKAEAAETSFAARWCLWMCRPKDALPLATQAAEAFKGLGYGRGWYAESRGLVTKALMGTHDWRGALRCARDNLEEFRQSPDDRRCLVVPLERLARCHLESWNVHRQVDTAVAHRIAEELLVVSQELGSKRWEAIAYHNIGEISFKGKQWDAAEGALGEATKICDEHGFLYEKAFVLNTLMDLSCDRDDADHRKRALPAASEARSIFQSLGKQIHEAFFVQLMAQSYILDSDFETGMQLAMEAQDMFKALGQRKAEADAWTLIARVQRLAGNVREAERSLRTASTLCTQSGDKSATAYALQAIAAECAAQDRYDDALLAGQEALVLARASRDTKAEVEMLTLVSQGILGQTYKRARAAEEKGLDTDMLWKVNEAKMLRPAREAVCLARKQGDDYHTAGAIYAVAMIHLAAGRLEAARNATLEVEEMWGRMENPGGVAYVWMLRAQIVQGLGKSADAVDLASKASEVFNKFGDKDGLDQSLALLEKLRKGGALQAAASAASGLPALEAPESSAAEPMAKGMDLEVAKKIALEVAITSIGDPDDVDLDSPLMDIGLDSLAAIAFRESLIEAAGMQLPTSLVFDYPSLASIADHLVETSMEQRR